VAPVIEENVPVVNCAVVPVMVWPLMVPVTVKPELKIPEDLPKIVPETVRSPVIVALAKAKLSKAPDTAWTLFPVIVSPLKV
jgi:hypothetical protein